VVPLARQKGGAVGLSIEDEETQQLVRELAALTGESQTTAVTVAVRERLEQVRRLRAASLSDRVLAIGRDTAQRLAEPGRSVDHGELLYDEDGLPI
jgi:antitoxin VapB